MFFSSDLLNSCKIPTDFSPKLNPLSFKLIMMKFFKSFTPMKLSTSGKNDE